MRLQSGNTSLVLAGSWNPAILTPNWIAQNALGFQPDREFQVGVQLPVQEFGQFPRFMFETLSVTATPAALTFHLDAGNNAQQVAKSVEVAAKILKLLPHTPVAGIGINFTFGDEAISDQISASFAGQDQLLNDLPAENEDAQIVQQSWNAALKLNDHVANVTCIRRGNGVEVGFNHHFDVTSAAAAAAILEKEGLHANLLDISRALLINLGNQE